MHAPKLAALHDFVVGRALPRWAGSGLDPMTGTFFEQLHLDGRPDVRAARRMRSQARQIYVYAHATLLGLFDGSALAERAFDRMIAEFWQPDGGFIFSVDPGGAPLDRSRTTYDQAFALLAMAWLYQLTGEASYLEWAVRTLDFVDARLAEPKHGGYIDYVGAVTRCQNPHMHLLEALLAWVDATGDAAFLQRADAVYTLFAETFLDRSVPGIREFFTADWRADPVSGDRLDPGHHFEWIWLLARYRQYRPNTIDESQLLFEFAELRGVDWRDGLVFDEVMADGAPLRATKRLWPQTEHLKAITVRFEASPSTGVGEIDRVCGLLLDNYLLPETGTWNDQIGDDGERLSHVSPASSFYHLFLAYAEAMRAVAHSAPR